MMNLFLKTKRYLFLLFFALFILNSVDAIQFEKLNDNEKLTSRRTYSATKDIKGYVWVANMLGIDKYDGDKFQHYNFNQFNDNARVRGVVIDKKGEVYGFSEKCIYQYNENKDGFEKIIINQQGNYVISSIYFDQKNNIWVGTDKGVFYRPDNLQWKKINQSSQYQAFCFSEINNSEILIGTNKGVLSINKKSLLQQSKNRYKPNQLNFNYSTQSLFFDKPNNTLWIGTLSDGLFVTNTSTNLFKQNLRTSGPIKTICKAPNNEMWVGVDGKGIFTFDSKQKTPISHYTKEESSENRLESNSILNLLSIDSIIYISTTTAGTWLCDFSKNENILYTHKKNNPNSLCNNYVNAILEDNSGDIWFGTQGGLSQFSPSKKTWQHFLCSSKDEFNVIHALCEDKQNNIWIGGYSTDLMYISKSNGKINIVKNQDYNSKYFISSIIQDRDGNIWFGGGTQLTKYSPNNKTFNEYKVSGIRKIYELNKDSIIVASMFGLYIIHKYTDKVSFIDLSKFKRNNLSLIPYINDLYFDYKQPNIIWLGSNGGGLYKYNLSNNKIRVFEIPGERSTNFTSSIVKDNLNRLWIGSENELNCFNLSKNKFEFSYQFVELKNSFINYLAYEKCKNGSIIWGTPYGAITINPKELKNNGSKINLRFTSFNLFDKKLTADVLNSPLKYSIDNTSELILNNDQRSFSFEFFNLHTTARIQTLYSWKLENFDKEWTQASKVHKAIYTNIPAGDYTFKVKAINAENPNLNVTRTIQIKVRPPFWASNTALILYFIFIISMIYFINKFIKNKIAVKRSEEKIRFFVNLAHDVRTPITLVKAPLTEIEKENLSVDGRSALLLAQKNLEKLFNTINQLLDFQRSENNAMMLLIEQTALNSFINASIGNLIVLAKEKNIKLETILPSEETMVWIDQKKIAICLENLISNAIKYGKELGEVKVKIIVVEQSLIIEVTDDGIGIPISNQKNLFERFFRADNAQISTEIGSGIGLSLTKRLVQLHKGKISFISTENLGTTFCIELPCQRENFNASEIILKQERTEVFVQNENIGTDLKGINLLLVEDNDEIRTYLAKQLRKEYNVAEAVNGKIALEMIKENAPDFILSDIMMPEMTGFELCSTLKNNIETSHIPIILLSALADRSDIVKGFNLGADDYITKPFDMSILELKIKTIVRNRVLIKDKFIDKTVKEEELSTINIVDRQFLERVIKLIEDNLMDEKFSIDNLSQEMTMSRSVFYKKVKALTSNSPMDLIRDIKMKKASNLLREKKYQMYEIAQFIGYPNSDYFSTAFKSYYGISPSKFTEIK